MSSIDELMLSLTDQDVKLSIDGGKLVCNAPSEVMTNELRSQLKKRKQEIIDYLDQVKNREIDSIPIVNRNQDIHLSVSQKRLWSLVELQPDTSIYNISTAYRLTGQLNVSLLERSLHEIQSRHEILRTTFKSKKSHPVQIIAKTSSVKVKVKNLNKINLENQNFQISNYLQTEIAESFDLSKDPLWRVTLLILGDEEFVLSFTFHHIIFDAWSRKVFLSELGECYNQLIAEKSPKLPTLPIQFADYAEWYNKWLESPALTKQNLYWKKQLAAPISETILPVDYPREAKRVFKNGAYPFCFSDVLHTNLKKLSLHEDVSLFITVLAAFNLTLSKYTGQNDLAICLPVACRSRSEIENLLGYFNNIVVTRTDFSNCVSCSELISRVRKTILEAFENQDFPFQKLIDQPALRKISLTKAMFSFRNQPAKLLNLNGIETKSIDIRKQNSDFDLAMYIESCDGNLAGILEYNSELFEKETIEQLIENFKVILSRISTEINLPLSSFPEFRVSLGEISSLLKEFSKVEDAFVLRSDFHQDNQCNVAYVVPNQYDIPEIAELRNYLGQKLPHYLVPLSFIPVDSFPLTAEGNINESELPPPIFSRNTDNSGYVPPKTPLEKRLVKVWTKVLWLEEEIGVDDNFFAFGGNSLSSVELVHEIEKELHIKLPVKALVKLSTIKELIDNIRHEDNPETKSDLAGEYFGLETDSNPTALSKKTGLSTAIYHGLLAHTAGWHGKRIHPKSLIFGLNTTGTKEPLFWCFQGYREMSQMAKYLGSDQPVFGMRSGHRVMKKNEKNITALAEYYAGEILSIQPNGSFLIGGNCQSAQIAFRIAKFLTSRGYFIQLLCLQEQFIPLPYHGSIAMFYGDGSGNNPLHYFENPEIEWKKYYTGALSVNFISGRHGEFFREPNIQVLADKLASEIEKAKQKQPSESAIQQDDLATESSSLTYKAKITAANTVFVVPGELFWLTVMVQNIGKSIIASNDTDKITIGNRCFREWGGNILSLDSGTSLVKRLEPDTSVSMKVQLKVPKQSGIYRFELDLVQNEIMWLKTKGTQTATITARVSNKFIFFKWCRTIRDCFSQPFNQ